MTPKRPLPPPPSLASLIHPEESELGGTPVRFIWASEKTGFRHLYLVERAAGTDSRRIKPLTAGEWQVLESEIWVDEENELVYFLAKKDTPLGNNLLCFYCYLFLISFETLTFSTLYQSINPKKQKTICMWLRSVRTATPDRLCGSLSRGTLTT